jgi:hypothetical protein
LSGREMRTSRPSTFTERSSSLATASDSTDGGPGNGPCRVLGEPHDGTRARGGTASPVFACGPGGTKDGDAP